MFATGTAGIEFDTCGKDWNTAINEPCTAFCRQSTSPRGYRDILKTGNDQANGHTVATFASCSAIGACIGEYPQKRLKWQQGQWYRERIDKAGYRMNQGASMNISERYPPEMNCSENTWSCRRQRMMSIKRKYHGRQRMYYWKPEPVEKASLKKALCYDQSFNLQNLKILPMNSFTEWPEC